MNNTLAERLQQLPASELIAIRNYLLTKSEGSRYVSMEQILQAERDQKSIGPLMYTYEIMAINTELDRRVDNIFKDFMHGEGVPMGASGIKPVGEYVKVEFVDLSNNKHSIPDVLIDREKCTIQLMGGTGTVLWAAKSFQVQGKEFDLRFTDKDNKEGTFLKCKTVDVVSAMGTVLIKYDSINYHL